MTDAPALAAPDQAVVAAFERIDIVIADPMREIVAGRVDPDRALADHVFAHRLLARAGTQVLVPAGPLIVAGDLAKGVPSDPATRAGRALALQLLAVALARRDGLGPDAVVVGAFPDWLIEESGAPARVAAEIALRRSLLPGHPLAFVEPAVRPDLAMLWHAIVGALLADAGDALAVVRRPGATPTEAAYTQATTGRGRRPARVTGRAGAAGHRARPRDAGRRGGDGDPARARGRGLDAASWTRRSRSRRATSVPTPSPSGPRPSTRSRSPFAGA